MEGRRYIAEGKLRWVGGRQVVDESDGYRCGYCQGRLVIEARESHELVKIRIHDNREPPPGAKRIESEARTITVRSRVSGRARCGKCGALYRSFEEPRYEADDASGWATVTPEEFDREEALSRGQSGWGWVKPVTPED